MSVERMRLLAVAVFFSLTSVEAATYSVQIGAYKNPAAVDTTKAAEVGEVSMREGRDGLTRIRVGKLETQEQAQASLQRLRSAGYSDAYISDTRGRALARTASGPSASTPPVTSDERRLAAAKAKLQPDQYGDIVYLDGRLTLKEGQQFRALE